MRLHRRDRGGTPGHGLVSTFASTALILLLSLSCRADSVEDVRTDTVIIPIGDSEAHLIVHRSDKPGLTYLNLHDDENTAVEAAVALIRAHGGTVYELQHEGERNLTFQLGESSYTVDPNRIFTPQGIEATLIRHGNVQPPAHAAVALFSDSLLRAVNIWSLDVVVTIHNNTEKGYSALSYGEDGDYADDAAFTHLAPDKDPDDFFFVTSRELFVALQSTGENVILQDNTNVRDDGSLSVLAAREGLPYVNVEAQHGHFERQLRMLESIHTLASER